jgi:hypothetical protein
MLDRCLREHLLHGGGEVFEDDDSLGAGVLELVFKLARGIERIDAAAVATGYCNTFGIISATRAPCCRPLPCR